MRTGRENKTGRGREKKTGRRGERMRKRGREKEDREKRREEERRREGEEEREKKEMGREGKEETGREGEERGREGGEEREKKRKGKRVMKREGDIESLERNNGDMMKEEETGWRGEEKIGKVWGKGVKRGEWQERMTGDSENANTRGETEGNGHCKKRKVNKFDNVDVECTVFENGQEAFDFKPTNRE